MATLKILGDACDDQWLFNVTDVKVISVFDIYPEQTAMGALTAAGLFEEVTGRTVIEASIDEKRNYDRAAVLLRVAFKDTEPCMVVASKNRNYLMSDSGQTIDKI